MVHCLREFCKLKEMLALIKVAKIAKLATVLVVRVINYIASKSSNKVVNTMGEYFHRKVTGTKSKPTFKWYNKKGLKQYYKAILRLERTNADEVLDDLDESQKTSHLSIETALRRAIDVATIVLLMVCGMKYRAVASTVFSIAGFLTGDEIICSMMSDLLMPDKIIVRLAKTLVLLMYAANESWSANAVEILEPLALVGSALMSNANREELKAMASIDKPELSKIFLENIKKREQQARMEKLWVMMQVLYSIMATKQVSECIGPVFGVLTLLIGCLGIFEDKREARAAIMMFIKGKAFVKFLSAIALLTPVQIGSTNFIVRSSAFMQIITGMFHDLKKYGTSWEKCAAMLKPHKISDYWKDKGLNSTNLHTISVNADDPMKERDTETGGLEIMNLVEVPLFIREKCDQTRFARQDDNMHAAAIHKRLGTNKRSPSLSGLVDQLAYMIANFCCLTIKQSNITKIKKALSTEGTAGEFAKRTMIGEDWKKGSLDFSIDMWEMLSEEFITYIMYNEITPTELFRYMMYRKREVLPIDEKGEVKITRLIQAAGLEMRIPDSVVFGDFNETMIEQREKTFSDIGMRLDHDLARFCDPWEQDWKIVADFSDFDGHQHPMHMMNCKYVRQIANLLFLEDTEEMVKNNYYLEGKYNLHVERKVDTNWGISIQMMGQLASGDIVTSDDNTMRACGFIYMTIAESNTENRLRNVHSAIDPKGKGMGDDIAIKGTIFTNPISVAASAYRQSARLGYKLKEMLYYGPTPQGDNAVRLGHKIEVVVLVGAENAISVPVLARPEERLYGKMLKCAELEGNITHKNINVIIAKQISYIGMLWGMPEIVMLGMGIIIIMVNRLKNKDWTYDSQISNDEIPYTWRTMKLDPTTISEYGPIQSTTGLIHVEHIKEILNPNRKEHQIEVAKWLKDIIIESSDLEEVEDLVDEQGYFRRNYAYSCLEYTIGDKITVETKQKSVNEQAKLYSGELCEHLKEAGDAMFLRENIEILCPSCIMARTRNLKNNYRIGAGTHVMPTTVYKTEEERSMANMTLEGIEKWADIWTMGQLPGSYEANEEDEIIGEKARPINSLLGN